MLTTITLLAGVSVAAVLVTGSRVLGLRRMVKHSTKVDVAFTIGAGVALAGTLTGIATAILAGLFMALALTVLKVLYGLVDRCGDAIAVLRGEAEPMDDEHDAKGNWIYNQAPYLHNGKL